MDKDIIEQLNSRLSKLNKLIAYVEDNLSSLPAGNLHIRRKNGKDYYYAESENCTNNYGVPIYDKKLISDMAQRSYYLKILRSAETERKTILQFLDRIPHGSFEDIYESLPESRQSLISPVRLTDRQYVERWQNQQYKHKAFYEGDPFFVTDRGERVRSKSEQLIANRLNAKGIPYKYECPITVNGEILHPDFTILRISDRKELYYEHLGKMGDEDYAYKTIKRINNYIMNDITPGKNLFTTMESYKVPFDIRTLDILIEENFR